MPFKKGETPIGAKPFQKGHSGNPGGRPKKLPHLEELLADVLSEEKDGIEAAKAILMALRAKATKGDVRAAEARLRLRAPVPPGARVRAAPPGLRPPF